MEIEILEQRCGGTEFVPSPHRLHLGAQNAEGVDRLQFILPAAWAECTLALYLRRSDGVQLAAIPLDTDGSVTVDRRLTGSVRGQWMLAAMGSSGYTAYTRPGSYDVYATLAHGTAAVRSCRPRCTSSSWRACWKAPAPQRRAPAAPRTVRQTRPCRRRWRKRLRTRSLPTAPMPTPAQSGGGRCAAGRELCPCRWTGAERERQGRRGAADRTGCGGCARARHSLAPARWCVSSA